MERIKLPTDIDTDALIDIVKSSDEEVSYDDRSKDDVKQYIFENNIKAGDDIVPAYVIYKHYVDWHGGKSARSNLGFFKKFGKLFRRRRVRGYSHYLLDSEPFDLPNDEKLINRKASGEKEADKKK